MTFIPEAGFHLLDQLLLYPAPTHKAEVLMAVIQEAGFHPLK